MLCSDYNHGSGSASSSVPASDIVDAQARNRRLFISPSPVGSMALRMAKQCV